MKADLKVNFAGLELKNPVIASSGTPTLSAATIKKAAENGAAAVVTKTVRLKTVKTVKLFRPRFLLINKGDVYDHSLTEKGAYFTLFRVNDPYPLASEFVKEIKIAKKTTDIPIIVSIGGDDLEEYEKLAMMMQDAGADALEISFHSSMDKSEMYPIVVKMVKRVADIPVIAKTMCGWYDPVTTANNLEAAGADAITGLGSVGLDALEIDVETGRPFLQPTHLGVGGTWYRSISLAYVSKMAQAVKIPISGVTGIVNWRDAVKYILVGATTVQICAAIYAKGYKVLGEVADGIEAYMERKGYNCIEDFRGRSLKNILSRREIKEDPSIIFAVQREVCIGCKLCSDRCFWDAISIVEKKAVIDEKKCQGCGLCSCICPVKAISIKKFA